MLFADSENIQKIEKQNENKVCLTGRGLQIFDGGGEAVFTFVLRIFGGGEVAFAFVFVLYPYGCGETGFEFVL